MVKAAISVGLFAFHGLLFLAFSSKTKNSTGPVEVYYGPEFEITVLPGGMGIVCPTTDTAACDTVPVRFLKLDGIKAFVLPDGKTVQVW